MRILDRLTTIARHAGDAIMAVYDTDFGVDFKDDDSPLTLADRNAHELIVTRLRDGWPGLPVLSEEGVSEIGPERLSWTRYWLVDPLDGTREFVKRNGEFTVNIALIEAGQPSLGVVLAPTTGALFGAARGQGAFKQNAGHRKESIRAARYDGGILRVVCSRSHRDARVDRFLAKVPSYEITPSGSSLKICLVAAGQADFYPRFGPTSEWDTAAAHCVLAEAGGQLTDLALEPLRYNKVSLLNPDFIAFGPGPRPWLDWLGD